MFHDAGASSLKRKMANCTGFQTAFSPAKTQQAAKAEAKTTKMPDLAGGMQVLALILILVGQIAAKC